MSKLFHVYVNGKLLLTKADAAKAFGAADHYMGLRHSVWVTSQLFREY